MLFLIALTLVLHQANALSTSCEEWARSLIPAQAFSDQEALGQYLWDYQAAIGPEAGPLSDWVLVEQTIRSEKKLVYKTLHGNTGSYDQGMENLYDANAPLELSTPSGNVIADDPAKRIVDQANSKLVIEGAQNPFRNSQFIDALVEVVTEENQKGLAPKVGTIPHWSLEYLSHCSNRVFKFNFSKLLLALARGDSSRLMPTSHDVELEEWILAQASESVTPVSLFRKAYEMSDGVVSDALLTIENVLSRNWRNPKREDLLLTHHLAPIANFYEGRGTRFGVWYHLFGMILYGYATNGLRAWEIGNFEHIGSLVMNHFDAQAQKGAANRNGGLIGAGLRRSIEDKSYLTQTPDPTKLESSRYLHLNEDFRDRIEVWSNPAYKLALFDRYLELTSLKGNLKNCSVEAIFDTGNGFAGGLKSYFDSVELKEGVAKKLFFTTPGVSGARIFLDHCETETGKVAAL